MRFFRIYLTIALIVCFHDPLLAAIEIQGLDSLYCIAGPKDTLIGIQPYGKTWSGPGITDLGSGVAVFDPAVAGVGTHYIIYNGAPFETTVIDIPITTLNPFANVCENNPSFVLSGGSPTGGFYTVGPDDSITIFDPAARGPGTHPVTYSYGFGACFDISPVQTIIVLAIPNVTLAPFSDVCIDVTPFALTGGSPAGGIYSGPGVAGGIFDPVAAGIGTHTITYTYSDGTCSDFATQSITVNSVPVASFTGLDTLYCDSDAAVILTGTPTDAGGTFSGSGINDNGNGTAIFDPATSGLGIHNITYTYTDVNGCQDSETKQVRVGTLLTMTGVGAVYCEDITTVPFTYDPAGGVFTPLPGLTDNGDGTADFDPSTAGTGTHTIEYTYTDIYGCVNVTTEDVEVAPIPNVTFIGLAASYCKNDSNILLSGNHAPSGTFSGPGVTDNGNGTAYFDPYKLAAGGPYNITYSYTEPGTGCSSFHTKQTSVLSIPTATLSGTTTICEGASANLTVTFTGTGPFDFIYTDGTTPVAVNGVNSPYTFAVSPLSTTTYTILSVTHANGCDNTGTGSAIVTVNPLVTITIQPVAQGGCPGDNITFSVEATGVNLSYQWQKDGVNIAGETNPNLPVNNIGAGDVGIYTCIVSSTCGGPLISDGAQLTLYTVTNITGQPVSKIVCEGKNTNFTVTASGTNLVYQWFKDGVALVNGGKISGATSNNLTITGVDLTDAADYTCRITGNCGTLTSDPATLSVEEDIVITTQPLNNAVCDGDNVIFHVVATGTNLLYQWQKDGVNLAGETNPDLAVNSVGPADVGVYKCNITNTCGTLSTNSVNLTIYNPTIITTQPVSKSICVGKSVSFTVVASGANLTYQWEKDGIPLVNGGKISGATSNSLAITSVATTDAGAYTVTVTGSCGIVTSAAAVLTVNQNLLITQQPAGASVCPDDTISIGVTASGTGLTYQWQKDGVNIPGETNANLIFAPVAAGDDGVYQCVLTGTCGTLNSTAAILEVYEDVVITANPVSQKKSCEGQNISFALSATGSNLTYQWRKDGTNLVNGGNISGATSTTLNITGLLLTDAGTYTCIVSGYCGTTNTIPSLLTVDEQVTITNQPTGKTICEGGNVSFNLTATGSNLTYQWQKDGANIAGATNAFLVINPASSANEGVYNCVVSNACGNTVSNTVSLTINDSTNITSHPASDNLCEGDDINFSVLATGSNLSYKWQKNGVDLADGGSVSGSSTSNLSISSLVAGDAGSYACIVSGSCGIFSSNAAILDVDENISITVQPADKNACNGNNVLFNVVATGTSLAYQWQKDGADIAGETGSTLVLSSVAAGDAGDYNCILSNYCGNLSTDVVTLTLDNPTVITLQPVDKTACEGENISFNVNATGSFLVYQWKKNGVNMADGGTVSGSQSKTLTISGLVTGDAAIYTCDITGSCGSLQSDPATLTVNEDVKITTQPVSKSVCPGNNVSFNVTATGTNPSYQWQKNGVNLVGETNPGLLLSAVTAADAGTYRCIVTGDCGILNTNTLSLVVYQNVTITSQPVSQQICEGDDAGFSITATGSGLTYQWQKDGVNLADGGSISGSATKDLTITGLVPGDAGNYQCIISGTCGSKTSNTVVMSVDEALAITTQPVNKNACIGDNIIFGVVATGSSPSYQWQKNGVDIAGETNSSLVLNSVVAGDAGTYQCILTNACGNLSTNIVTLTISSSTAITTHPVDVTACETGNASFNVNATGSYLLYQWKKNGTDL
ncbi:MAG: hypothetical protein AMS27_17420, partial [Bacteroides sp. SM23_62_1]